MQRFIPSLGIGGLTAEAAAASRRPSGERDRVTRLLMPSSSRADFELKSRDLGGATKPM